MCQISRLTFCINFGCALSTKSFVCSLYYSAHILSDKQTPRLGSFGVKENWRAKRAIEGDGRGRVGGDLFPSPQSALAKCSQIFSTFAGVEGVGGGGGTPI